MTNWTKICPVAEIPKQGARVVEREAGNVGIFRTKDDEIFALLDRCPHKNGPLSQGIVHGKRVTCPLHSWKIELETGEAVAPDEGCAARFEVKVEDDYVYLAL